MADQPKCKCGHLLWRHTTRCRWKDCKCRLSWQQVRVAGRENVAKSQPL